MAAFQNKIAVITGAGSGIGRALVLNMAAQKANIMAADIDAKTLAETADLVKTSTGQEIKTTQLDVSDKDAVYQLAGDVANRMGAPDLLINNAGVAQVAAVQDLHLQDLEWVMNINYWGVVYGTQAFLPQMLQADKGHIVNISSIFGLVGVPRQAAYCSAKFAVLGYTESLRHDMRETNVRVSVVHPGGIKTNIARKARHNQGPDLAERQETMVKNFDEMAPTSPEKAAETILRGVRKNKPRIRIGFDSVYIDWIRRCFPVAYARILPFTRDTELTDS